MTPDQMRDRVLLASNEVIPPKGLRTLWIATSQGGLQEGVHIPDRLLHTTPVIEPQEFRRNYVDFMLHEHQAHILASTEQSEGADGEPILLIDIISANRRMATCVELIQNKPIGPVKRSGEGVFTQSDVEHHQETIRRNVMLTESTL